MTTSCARKVLVSAALVIGYGATGCGASSDSELELGRLEQAIAGGEVDESENWPGVLLLHTKVDSSQGQQACTGTLVAPNLVLSALHCVAPLRDSNFECNPDGSVTQNAPGAGELGSPVDASYVEVRVGLDAATSDIAAYGKQLLTTNSLNICNNDLALIILDTELDLPLSRLRLEADVEQGESLTIVGYGTNGVSGSSVTRRAVEPIRVVEVGSDSGENPTSGAPPRTFVVGPSACKGDSGGPAFSKNEAGDPVLIGVDSIVVGSCGASTSRSIYTRLAPFEKLITSAFKAAGYPAWTENQTEPGVDPEPVVPDGGTDTAEEPVPEEPVKAQRLKTGCSMPSSSEPEWAHFFGLLPLALAAWLRRRNTTPISLR